MYFSWHSVDRSYVEIWFVLNSGQENMYGQSRTLRALARILFLVSGSLFSKTSAQIKLQPRFEDFREKQTSGIMADSSGGHINIFRGYTRGPCSQGM